MEFLFDFNAPRARRARLQKQLGNRVLQITLLLISLGFIALGLALLFTDQALGWIFLATAVPFGMIRTWYNGDLKIITANKNVTPSVIQLHEVLEAPLLARLPQRSDLSAYDIWKSIEGSEEHYFLANRYGIDASFFETLSDRTPGTGTSVWAAAHQLQLTHDFATLSTIAVLIGLVHVVPDVQTVLRRAEIELTDIVSAIDWLQDIQAKREFAKQAQNFGGIGRDWAYGYTPILRGLGHNISEGIQMHGFFSDTRAHEPVVDQMAQIMGSSNATVTLVGEEGVGKTTCVYAYAQALLSDTSLPQKIRYNQIIQLDATTLIARAQRPGELENLMIRALNEAHHAKNIVLFFDDAQLFFGAQGGIDLSSILMPAIESSSVRLIFAMNPQHWQQLSSSGVAARLTPVNVAPLGESDTLPVLRDQIILYEFRHKVIYTYEALKEAYKLGSRYVTTQAMPGAALQVLEQAGAVANQKLITREVVQQSIEQTYGIKLQVASGGETDNLLNLETELHKQVISQERAISVVANALRRARSGVGNPDRPIGTFLFLGPTGVGKTELTKAVARSYFGNEQALIRVDMNQFVNAEDVTRLISPLSSTDLGFLGQVRKQPFSVVLFDEIEKAHPSVVNALLQMLDEGIMRDNENRAVSFRDAIIIATSNAGADDIRTMIEAGQDITQLENTFIDTLISKGSFAPEFLNRFDEVVLFKPLDQTDLVRVIDLIVSDINKTIDPQKVSVSLTPQAKQWLVAKGYDSKLGARPMRRMAQRYVENIVAKRLLEGSVVAGGSIQLDTNDFES